MKKQWGRVVIAVVSVVAVVLVGFLVVKIFFGHDTEELEATSTEDSKEVYGYVDSEIVVNLVAKFNTEIMDQTGWELMPVDDTLMVAYDGSYWYPLYEDVALVVVPVEFSGDKERDEVMTMLIYTDQDSVNREKALEYFKYLIRANDEELSDEEVTELMTESENLRERGEMANHGKGIFVAINGSGDHMEYQVVRNYREESQE